MRGIIAFAYLLLSCLFVIQADGTSLCSRVTTFNVALMPLVPGYEARKFPILDALRTENADVLCLQEYWFERDMQEMIDNLTDVYPYHYSFIHHDIGHLRQPSDVTEVPDSACSQRDVQLLRDLLMPCAVSKGCLDILATSQQRAVQCIVQECGSIMRQDLIASDCFSCLFLSGSVMSSISESPCLKANPESAPNRWNRFGLVMLSKQDMSDVTVASYFPGQHMTLPRGYIAASIAEVGQVVCTHLSAIFDHYFEYDLDFRSYEDQQRLEMDTLRARFGDTDHVLLGDLNCGPVVADSHVSGEIVANYNYLLNSGYRNRYLSDDGRCTYCRTNALGTIRANHVLDHVLLKGNSSMTRQATRTLDLTGEATLSDHYGVRAEVCPTA